MDAPARRNWDQSVWTLQLPNRPSEHFQFGAFTLDLGRGTLAHPDGEVFLRPKAYTLLTHLARNLGRVVPKSELMDAAWPNVYVTEDSLTQSIREIRKALGATGAELLRTAAKRGYVLTGGTNAPPAETAQQPVVAVLRFRNDSDDPAREHVVDGFAEDIITGLSHFGSVTVLARESTFQFGSLEPGDRAKVGTRIGADYLVEGVVRWSRDGAVVGVNLIDAKDLRQLWGERYEAADLEVFDVQREIGEQIVNRLVSRLDAVNVPRMAAKPATSLAVYELVARAVAELRGPNYYKAHSAIADLKLAIEKDPSYAAAYSHLAMGEIAIAGFPRAPIEVLERALASATQGVLLAPTLSIGTRVRSLVRLLLRQHAGAEADLRQALQLNRYDADAVEQMGYLLTLRGQSAGAVDWINRAKRLNPIFPDWYHYDAGLALYGLGEYRAAADALEQPARLPPWVSSRLAGCYMQLGDLDKARRYMTTARQTPGFDPVQDAKNLPFEHQGDLDHLLEGIERAASA